MYSSDLQGEGGIYNFPSRAFRICERAWRRLVSPADPLGFTRLIRFFLCFSILCCFWVFLFSTVFVFLLIFCCFWIFAFFILFLYFHSFLLFFFFSFRFSYFLIYTIYKTTHKQSATWRNAVISEQSQNRHRTIRLSKRQLSALTQQSFCSIQMIQN